MKKTRIYILFVCYLSSICVFFSCNGYQNMQADRVMNIPNNEDRLDLHDIFTDFKVVELENNEKCMLSKVSKMQYTDSMIYVWNQNATPSLYAFHKDGKFHKEIGRRGNGRGEYQNIVDFTVDESGKKIYILSELSTVFVYSTDGDFIESKHLSKKSFFRNILKVNDGFVFSTNHLRLEDNKDESLLYFFDNDLNMTRRKLNVLPKPMFQPPFVRFPLQKDNSYICYYDNFNTCFHFISMADSTEHETVTFYNDRIYDYEDVISERVFKNGADYDEVTREFYADGIVYGWGNFFNIYNVFFYDKNKNELKVYNYTDWNPDIMDYQNKRFYSVISPDVFLNPEMYKSERTEHLLKKLKESLSDDYDYDSNFCILSFKRK